MAREHARIWLDINADDDFEKLPFDAQGFYTRVILTLDLNWCGVGDWRPRKLTSKAPDLPFARIQEAAWHLEDGRYCLFDLDTEEVLARSYIRRDELLRNPKMAAAVVKAYGDTASKVLRAAIVTEIRRVREEHPEYSSWANENTGPALSKIMGKPGLDEVDYLPQITIVEPVWKTNRIAVPNTNQVPVQNTIAQPVPNTDTDPGPEHQSNSVPIPSTYTSTSTPAPLEGYVSTEGHQGTEPDPNTPPPRYCDEHMPDGTNKPCTRCKHQRQAFDRWQANTDIDSKAAAQEQARAEAALRAEAGAARALEIAGCHLCDSDGYTPNRAVCDHVDHSETNRRGLELARAALTKETR